MVAAEMAPTAKYATQRIRRVRAWPALRQLAGRRPRAALRATAGTAAPAPAAAPLTHSGGWAAKKRAERAKMITSPGAMKQRPPIRPPRRPRNLQAQKMASWVEAGPGKRLVEEMASSNSWALSQPRSSTQSWRKRAIWAGGPPKPMIPIRLHSRTMVENGTLRSADSVIVAWPVRSTVVEDRDG